MPKAVSNMRFGGRTVASVQYALEMLERNGIDDACIRGKANSYRCPIGEEAGQGWLLMMRQDVEYLARQPTSSSSILQHTLTVQVGGAQVNLQGLIFVRAFRLIPSESQDRDALYLVEISDLRYLAQRAAINRRFNLRPPHCAGESYIEETTNGGTPWTWTEVIQQIWGQNLTAVIGSYSGSLISARTPANVPKPENLRYEGTSSWHALCDALHRTGREMRFNPIGGSFSAVQMGDGTTDENAENPSPIHIGGGGSRINRMTDDPTTRYGFDIQLEDAETIAGPYLYPATVTVFFPTAFAQSELFNAINDSYGQFYYVTVAGSSLTIGNTYTAPSSGILAGSTVALFDQMPARFTAADDSTPANDSDLQDRAAEVAEDYYRSLVDGTPARWVFSGPRSLIPGPFITEVIWRDFGDGVKTEVTRYRPKIGAERPQKPVPPGFQWGRGRLSEELSPSGTAELSVYRWDEDSEEWVDTEIPVTVRAGLPITGAVAADTDVWYALRDGVYWALLEACGDDTTTTTTTAP